MRTSWRKRDLLSTFTVTSRRNLRSMKRAQEQPSVSPAHKKAKTSPDDDEGGEWTKVERRKSKKSKKAENRLDVCVSHFPFSVFSNILAIY